VRLRVGILSALVSLLCGCGYVGPVLPPSPMLPQAITDLSVVEQGDQLVIRFTVPVRTSDNLVIRDFDSIDLRIGEAPTPFDFDRWAAKATPVKTELPPETDPDNPLPASMSATVPAKDWIGKRVVVAVRTSVRKKDHFSAWSNRGLLNVLPPLPAPVVSYESTAQGVLLKWPDQGDEIQYRVYRKQGADTSPLLLGTSSKPEYLDTSSQYETPYDYTVVAFKGKVESLESAPQHVVTIDKFPPSIPTGVTALAGPNSIEVSWQRSPESDLKGYYVYRSVDGGPYQQVGDLLTVPTYSDRDVQHGKTYRYQINAVDQKGNPSDRSVPIQVSY